MVSYLCSDNNIEVISVPISVMPKFIGNQVTPLILMFRFSIVGISKCPSCFMTCVNWLDKDFCGLLCRACMLEQNFGFHSDISSSCSVYRPF
jgi:hypothetical protein